MYRVKMKYNIQQVKRSSSSTDSLIVTAEDEDSEEETSCGSLHDRRNHNWSFSFREQSDLGHKHAG
jgi:hypothetical protein